MGFGAVGVKEFIKLDDTPASYAGQSGKVAAVKAVENALEFIAVATTFLGLTDTPGTYVGQRGKHVIVNGALTGLEFLDKSGFGDDWQRYDPSGQLAASLAWEFDQVSFGVTGVGIDVRLYTASMRAVGFRRPLTIEFKLTRGPDAGANPNVWAALVGATADIRNNMDQDCCGWKTGPSGEVSCFNGSGAGSTITNFAWGNWPPIWLKAVISDTDIKFYANNALVATHNTNLPDLTNSAFFAIQAYGTGAGPRRVYMTQPHFRGE